MDTRQEFHITPEQAGGRVDAVLAACDGGALSRSRIKALIKEGRLTCNGMRVEDPSRSVKAGEAYLLQVPAPVPLSLTPVAIPFGLIYEDEHLLVIDKPAGLTVHPAAGNMERTLVHALLAHCGESLSGIGGALRPGIVHRLDKDTSGLMIVAKHDAAHRALSAQLADRSLSRQYAALVWGLPVPSRGTVDAPMGRSPSNRKKMAVLPQGGKQAITHYATQQVFSAGQPGGALVPVLSRIACRLQTGRTHQIRVHMTHRGHALVGDPLYGVRGGAKSGKHLPPPLAEIIRCFPRQALHAAQLAFVHPVTGEALAFQCNLPQDMVELLDACGTHLATATASKEY